MGHREFTAYGPVLIAGPASSPDRAPPSRSGRLFSAPAAPSAPLPVLALRDPPVPLWRGNNIA